MEWEPYSSQVTKKQKTKNKKYMSAKNILIYTGHSIHEWNKN